MCNLWSVNNRQIASHSTATAASVAVAGYAVSADFIAAGILLGATGNIAKGIFTASAGVMGIATLTAAIARRIGKEKSTPSALIQIAEETAAVATIVMMATTTIGELLGEEGIALFALGVGGTLGFIAIKNLLDERRVEPDPDTLLSKML